MTWEVILAFLVGGPIIGWFFVSGIRERRRRREYEDYFVPLVGGYLTVTGGRYWCYEVRGDFSGRSVRILCPPLLGSRTTLRVKDLRTTLHDLTMKGWNPPALEYEGRLYAPISTELALMGETFGRINESPDLRSAVKTELERLCQVADKLEKGELAYDGVVAK